MKTDVEIKVSGLPFDEAAVSGISLYYGVNTIPTATLELDAGYLMENAPGFLCDPESYKKRSIEVSITVLSKTGCVQFDGFFDGLSVSQSVGNLSYSAVIKNKFQRLLEIYPRTFGIMPGSFNIFTDPDQLFAQHGDPLRQFTAVQIGKLTSIKTNGSIPEFIVELLKAMVETQYDATKYIKPSKGANDILKLMTDAYKKNLDESRSLLAKIDLSYVKDCAIQSAFCADAIMKLTNQQFTDLWSMLVGVFHEIGCCVVVGNNNLTILPETKFLKFDHDVPDPQYTNIETNIANPGQYNNFSTSDTGRVNIKAVYVTADTANMPGRSGFNLTNEFISTMGVYPKDGTDSEIPDDGADGILIVNSTPFFCTAINGYGTTNPKAQSSQAAGNAPFTIPILDPVGIVTAIYAKLKEYDDAKLTFNKLRDQYAKIKFLQAKYEDRVGQLTTYFNPRWVPGTSGSLYIRLPGTFKQFYVTGVNHMISKKAPNSGTAATSVSFCSVRQGTSGKIPGIKADDLYQYTQGKMKQFQESWVADISDTVG